MAMLQRMRRRLSLRQVFPPEVDNGEADPRIIAEPAAEITEGESAYGDEGMSTVEYAVGTVAAAAFAAVLYRIVTGDSVIAGLTNLVNSAMNTSF